MRRAFVFFSALALLAGPANLPAQGIAVAGSPMGGGAPAVSAPTVVIIVRHADKAAQPANDPPLTEVGVARAQALAAALAEAKVAAVYSTATTRTRETARPIAERAGVSVQPIAGQGMAGMTAAVVEAVKANPGKTVVIVGHSNTVMPWIAALGGPKRPDLCDHHYDGLYTLVLDGVTARLIEGHYGPPNPPETAPCATSQMRP